MNDPALKINLEDATHFVEVGDEEAVPIIRKGNIAVLTKVPAEEILSLTSGIFMGITAAGSKHFFRAVRSKNVLWMYKLDNTPLNSKGQVDSMYRVEAIYHSEREMPKDLHCARI